MSNSGKVLFNGFVSSKSKKSNNKNHRNIRKISREEIQQIKNQSVKKYDNKHRIFNISRNELRQNYRNNYNNTGNYRYNYIKNAGIINKSKNNQHNFNSSYSSSTSKVLFSNANSNSSSNYYNILDNYNFSDGLNVIKSVNLNGKNIKSITTSKSTVKLITLKDTTGCDLNFIFNIEGGPQGEQGPDGKSLTSVTYTLGQDVGTTSDVIFDTVEATNPSSYSLGGVSVTAAQWAHLVTMNQYVGTTADVIFNSVTATTSYTLGSTTIDATQWNRLATIDQDLSTTDNVTFNSVTATTSYSLGSTTIDAIVWNHLASIDQDLSTTDNVTFNSVTATTSYTLGSTIIDATTWIHLATIDQDLSTTDNVTFNSVTATTSYTLGSTTIDATQWNRLATIDQDLSTTSDVTFNSVTATTSYTLGSTIIDATTWNHLAIIDQDLSTTSDVNFNSVTIPVNNRITLRSTGDVALSGNATSQHRFYFGPNGGDFKLVIFNSFIFPNLTNQYDLGTSSNRFQTLYLGTSIDIGGTAIDATQWNRLAIIDQDLSTTSDVNFNSITIVGGGANTDYKALLLRSDGDKNRIWASGTSQMRFIVQGGGAGTMFFTGGNLWPLNNQLDLGTSSNRWKSAYLGTSIILNGTTIGTTQWDILSTYQTLRTNNDVRFNSVLVPYGSNGSVTPIILGPPGTAKIGLIAANNNRIILHVSKNNINANYKMELTTLWPQQTNSRNLGTNTKKWKNLYLSQKANVGQLNISNPTVPGTTAASGTTGDIEWGDDGGTDYLYVCVGTDSWKRLALSTW